MRSNSAVLVDREHVHGVIGGVDFGPRTFVLVRSPWSLLLWLGGHSISVNGHVSYSEAGLVLVKQRREMNRPGCYRWLGYRGGRLTLQRVAGIRDDLVPVFGHQVLGDIEEGVRSRGTLLIEGGGDALRGAR